MREFVKLLSLFTFRMRFNFNKLSPEVFLNLPLSSKPFNKSDVCSARPEIMAIHFCRKFIPLKLNLQPVIYIAFTLTALNLPVIKIITH